jgi:hypothetical protein
MPEDAKAYLARAQHCLDIARAMDGSHRLILLEMAQAWTRLAQQAERNRKNDMVYETPRTRRPASQSRGDRDTT